LQHAEGQFLGVTAAGDLVHNSSLLQVGLIKSTEVDIQNKLSDQSELRKSEDKKVHHWTKEVAKKRSELAVSFPEGGHPA